MLTRAFGLSDQGRVRKNNEDAFACADDLQLFVVADGMGGHSAGEVAARLAIDAIIGFASRSTANGEFSWPYGVDPQFSFEGNRLRTAIQLANRRVFRAAEEQDEYTGMGTTVVSALVTDTGFIVGHVGDSRLYLWSGGVLMRLTRDDSWAMTVLAEELREDAEALARHPMRNVLTNVLGARDQTEIHIAEHPLTGGDVLLLCSDGLHSVLKDADIARILAADPDVHTCAPTLITTALDGGSRDNVTVVLVSCGA